MSGQERMMNKRTAAFLLVLIAASAMVFAADIFVSFDWTGVENVPQYLRYQVDGQEDGLWIACDSSVPGILITVDENADHTVYVQASYDGTIWSVSAEAFYAAAVAVSEPAAEPEVATTEAVAEVEAEAPAEKKGTYGITSFDFAGALYQTQSGLSKALSISYARDYFSGNSKVGAGFVLGLFWDKPMTLGFKFGGEVAYKLGLIGFAAGIGGMVDMNVLTHDALTFSFVGEAGLRLYANNDFSIGAKINYILPIKTKAL